ncbi:hypothetical protein M9H77_18881 [Catharanthus roseus]|uniref:Uncharacterized protein n=1 Tax=Catharanthus roseus TaxID=4058 RepID=A0ACC0B8V4_CATRO|nr:hypothetical protein M9H77_18881 [Catharanthus roseus]
MKLKLGPITRAKRKKLKILEDNGILFSMCSFSKDHSREQVGGGNGESLKEEQPIADGSPAPTIAQHLEDHSLPPTVACLDFKFLPIAFVCNLIVTRLDYLQGCLEFKKEEQSRATNRGLIGAID